MALIRTTGPNRRVLLLLEESQEAFLVTMRVKILRPPPSSSTDGVRLDFFSVGQEYEVGNTTAAYLLAEGWAEPVPLDAPKPIEPFADGDPFDSRTLYRSRPSNLIK